MLRLGRFLLECIGTAAMFLYASHLGPGLAFIVGCGWMVVVFSLDWDTVPRKWAGR